MDAGRRAGLGLPGDEHDHLDAVSAGEDVGDDDLEAEENEAGGGGGGNTRKRKKRYHRHTPQQIQELEALFKECPHPDDKQRQELSKRLCLEARQVKFWFQNRRTQLKTQMERHENAILKQENDRLRAENLSMREAMRHPVCCACGGPAVLGDASLEEQHLRFENARLKDELTRVCALASKFLGKTVPPPAAGGLPPLPFPVPAVTSSPLELAVGNNAFPVVGAIPSSFPGFTDFAISSPMGTVVTPSRGSAPLALDSSVDKSLERSLLLDLALSAMDELVKLAQADGPLWVPGFDGRGETLNYEEYLRLFSPCIGARPQSFVTEATRDTAIVFVSSSALVETLMDAARWSDMFSCSVAKASTTEVITNGCGDKNGALQLMHAELQVLAPLVPVREASFLRFCKQLSDGTWAVVDVSTDSVRESPPPTPGNMSCRRLPSGCVIQDNANGYCKVTWVEHSEYDEKAVQHLYRPVVCSGLALGASRWLLTLRRQCECLAILMSSSLPLHDNAAITSAGRLSMLKLARRMTENFCAGVSASSSRKWSKLVGAGGVHGEDVRVMTRQSVDEPGEPPGVVLSAATSVWMSVAPSQLFDFLRDEGQRGDWDILSNGGPMQEMAHIAKGQHRGNAVSLLRASGMNGNQSSMLILQETCMDASGSMVVYAPVDVPAMHLVMSGGDSTYVALLPSGFAILPDGPGTSGAPASGGKVPSGGSLLTVAFQILVNSQPTAKLTMESVETVNNLIACTIKKIKTALNCGDVA